MLVFVICVVVAPVRQRNEAWDKLGDRQYLNPEVKGLAVKVDSAKVKDIDVCIPVYRWVCVWPLLGDR